MKVSNTEKKLYKANTPVQWDSFEKETIDEIIFRTTKLRNRLILGLMARDGLKICMLKLRGRIVNW